jgi:hypothetical protein
MKNSKNKTLSQRKHHNSDLIRRMRNGEPLNIIDSRSSWFPPRPVIKKDEVEIARVYGNGDSGGTMPALASVEQPDPMAQVKRFRAS